MNYLELHKKIISKMLEMRDCEDFDQEMYGWYDKEIMPTDKRGVNEIIFEDIQVKMGGYGKITPSKADELYKNNPSLYWAIIHDIAIHDLDLTIKVNK